jgi:hypothetical protein
MNEFLQLCFSWPTVVPSVLMCVVLVYWLLMILGALDMEFLDFDFGLDAADGGDVTFADWGMLGLKWFNLGDVPLMFWLTAFAFPAWIAATIFNRELADPSQVDIAKALARDFIIGMFAAKALTQPVKGKFRHKQPHPAEEMIGRMVTITSSEVTTAFGQAQYQTGQGAPLILDVRTLEGVVGKGESARIVDYSPEARLYYVEK